MMFYLPVFMQADQGPDRTRSGTADAAPSAGHGGVDANRRRLYDKIGMRWLAVPGMALAGYGTWLLTGINPDMTEGDRRAGPACGPPGWGWP